jgi:AcrR family transcriptional regulator
MSADQQRMPYDLRVTLRDRKKARTRQALVDAAVQLFTERGYEQTTVADIAAAAEIGTRTFFSYFASKEDLLFPQADARVQAALDAIAERKPGDRPADILLQALRNAGAPDDDLVSPLAALRLELAQTVPVVRGKGLQLQLEAQQEIARHLHEAFPDELDPVSAAALVGAFIGAVTGALLVMLADAPADDPAALKERLQAATAVALKPWVRQ